MISRLSGRLIEKCPPQIVIDVQGVGYEVDVSMQTYYVLPALNEPVNVYTQLVIREDAHLLFGFASKEERATFRQLVKVSGIGAKTAMGILSALSSDDLANAIEREDLKCLSSVPGIGKKTAERMVLELRGKLSTLTPVSGLFGASGQAAQSHDDVVSTLLALGYTEKEARAAIKGLPQDVDVSEGVRLALKNITK